MKISALKNTILVSRHFIPFVRLTHAGIFEPIFRHDIIRDVGNSIEPTFHLHHWLWKRSLEQSARGRYGEKPYFTNTELIVTHVP